MPKRRMKMYSKDDFSNLSEIGSGSFGVVYHATLRNFGDVAVKKVQSKNEAAREANRAMSFNHPNVIKLYGMANKGNSVPWLILEYMERGNLIDYIQNYSGGCPAVGMIKMAWGIACGMDYLHRRASVVHRDLAARNILIGEAWDVKIGDFGLCNDYCTGEEDYYDDGNGRPCPIRWMPPENQPITGRKYSRKGDVWSYGVVLFEMWSRGRVPYETIDSSEDVMDAIVKGTTPLDCRNVLARSYVIDLMNCCWEYDPTKRPNFRMILETIEENEPCLFGDSDSDGYSD